MPSLIALRVADGVNVRVGGLPLVMRRVAYAACVLIALAGCGERTATVARVADASGPQVSCGGAEAAFPFGLLAGPRTDLAAGDEADRALLDELQDEQTFGAGEGKLPVTGWFRVVRRDDMASWVRSEDRRTVLAAVDFERDEEGWTYLRSSPAGCALRLVEPGVEFARVGFATVHGARVELQAEGGSCGGAGPTVDRVEVDETLSSVTVVVRLRPEARADSSAACAGVGVSVPVSVELKQPLGSRDLLDGSEVPAASVRTQPSG